MTPTKTIGCWTILDPTGSAWLVQCQACQRKTAFPKSLLSGDYPPRCKCGGKVAAKPVEASKPPEAAAVQPEPVDNPVDKPATPPMADAFFKIFGMVPVAKPAKVKPEPKPKAVKEPKPSRQKRRTTTLEVGQRIHQLTVLGDAETSGGRAMVRVRCDCGVERDCLRWHLAKGNIRSCGCLRDAPAQMHYNMRTVALPGDVFGSLTVIEEAPKQGKNRVVIAECRHCSMRWRVSIQNLRRTTDVCACAMRWAVSAAGIEEAHRIREAQKAKRADYDRLRKCRELDRQIHAVEVRLAVLRAKRESLTQPATVAQGGR